MKYRVVPQSRDRYTREFAVVHDEPTVYVAFDARCEDEATAQRIADFLNSTQEPVQ